MDILVIGAHGFLGYHLYQHFINLNHRVVFCSTHPDPLIKTFQIKDSSKDFQPIFEQQTFDLCFNASGSSSVGFSLHHPKDDFYKNVTTLEHLLNAIQTHSPHTKLVHLSSAAVYGQTQEKAIPESHPTQPFSPYGSHKLKAEQLCKKYSSPITHCRVFSVYGPNLKKQLFWDLYQKTKHHQMIELFGTGQETRDYIYIDDFLQSMECIINHSPFNQNIINIGNGETITTQQASETFLKLSQSKARINFNQEPRAGDPNHYCANNSLLKSYGYQQKISFTRGLSNYIQWLGTI